MFWFGLYIISKINKLRVFGSGMGKKKTITLSEDDIRGIKTGVFNLKKEGQSSLKIANPMEHACFLGCWERLASFISLKRVKSALFSISNNDSCLK